MLRFEVMLGFKKGMALKCTDIVGASIGETLRNIDLETPRVRRFLDGMSSQNRKVLVAIAGYACFGLTAKDIGLVTHIYQTNHVWAIISRLRDDGLIEETEFLGKKHWRVVDKNLMFVYWTRRNRSWLSI